MSSFGVSLSGLSACKIKQHVIGHPLELSIRNPHLIGGHFQNDLCMWCLKRPAQPKFQWDIKAIEANARWRHNMPAVMCRAGFRFVCHAFSPARCHFQHSSVVPVAPCGGNWRLQVYVKIGRPKCTQTLTVIFFVDHEILFYFVQRVYISKLIFMYLQQEVSLGYRKLSPG